MPQPGFYNDNEYRAYPFVYRPNAGDILLPNSAVVDAGIILGLDAFTTDIRDYSVWLTSIERTNTSFTFALVYAPTNGAAGTTLTFTRPDNNDDAWVSIFAESAHTGDNADPIWEGFLVAGPVTDLRKILSVGQTLHFVRNAYQIEPGLVQNLHNAYLRSITVANYDRTRIPACDTSTPGNINAAPVANAADFCTSILQTTTTNTNRRIIVHTNKMTGDIRLKEGYNCQITQTDRAHELSITALKNAGAPVDAELCAHGSELPLYDDEPFGVDGTETVLVAGVLTTRSKQSKFYSGGPACSEVISSINGLAGTGINIIGGNGVAVTTDGSKITVTRKDNAQTNCTTPQGQ
jgi:hypothetical protein